MYKNYDCTLETALEHLEKYGVAVIPNVLSEERCVEIRNQIWDEVKYVTKGAVDVEDKSTWPNFYSHFIPLHGMLLQHHTLGQMEPIWKVREDDNVCNVFSKLWNTPVDDLLVSFDGLAISLPHEVTKRGYYRGNDWLHTDQSSLKKGRMCIQGFVNLYPARDGDAALTVYEGSHKYHEQFFEENKIVEKNDWYKLKEGEPEYFLKKGCELHRVLAGTGSMVLWDSRTFHQGGEPLKTRAEPNFRMVVYVCMLPRAIADKKALEKRITAFKEQRMTTHWPTKPKLFSKEPRTYGAELPEYNKVHRASLNPRRCRLIGYEKTNYVIIRIKKKKD